MAAGLVVLSSACGPDGGSTTAVDDPPAGSSPTSAAPSVPAPRASATTTPAPPPTPAALDALFALGGYPTDDAWSFESCGTPLETTPSSGVSCRFTIPGEVHGVTVEMALRDDHVVEAVQSIG